MRISSNIENYDNNINCMLTTKEIKKEMQLITNLKPYIDAEGILHDYGRLDKSNFPFQVHHSMILSKRHPYTECVISDIHQKSNIQVQWSHWQHLEKHIGLMAVSVPWNTIFVSAAFAYVGVRGP